MRAIGPVIETKGDESLDETKYILDILVLFCILMGSLDGLVRE